MSNRSFEDAAEDLRAAWQALLVAIVESFGVERFLDWLDVQPRWTTLAVFHGVGILYLICVVLTGVK